MTVPTEHQGSRTSWHCVHVHFHEPDVDRLILDAVRPLFQQVRSRVDGLHLARHWLRGPHLRLFARTDPDTWARVVRPRVDTVVGGYLAAHPSTAVPDLEHELAQHRFLARRERERGPLTPWFPDNSIHEQPYDARPHVIRSPEVGELMAEFASAGTQPLFRMLEQVRAGADAKELIALELMLATTAAARPPVAAGFASYRSHAEAFLRSCRDPEAVRAAFDAHYESRREAFTARTRAVLATLGGGVDRTPYARRWAALCREHGRRARPLVERGLVFPPPVEPPAAPVHALPLGDRAHREALRRDPGFLTYRFLLNCAHLQVGRLGLTPFQRFRTCHAAANAVEEVLGVRAVDAVRAHVEARPDPTP
ncbi:thiopeptide maturation pyridine synthase [Actinosynnema sp. NPDC053489]|uniref:thiopeptide maturation pyridine synthase n=1 Tax=Actinosynnema sp. NPDC053489 TaxID=3363916 RepID=UPI0037C65B2B